MSETVETTEMEVCVDCYLTIALGVSEDPDPRWSPEDMEWPESGELVPGEQSQEFSKWRCDCCGSALAGARYEVIRVEI